MPPLSLSYIIIEILLVESELYYTYQEQTNVKLVFLTQCVKNDLRQFPPPKPADTGLKLPIFITMCFDKVDKTDGGVGVGRWVQYRYLFVPGKYNIILTLRAESLLYSYLLRNKQMWRLSQSLKQLYWSLLLDLKPHRFTSKGGVVIATPFNVEYLYQAEHQRTNIMDNI